MQASAAAGDAVRLDWPMASVARLTLARAAELNTLTFETVAALDAAIDTVKDRGARVLIVTGEARAFCAGAHIAYFVDPVSPLFGDPDAVRDRYVAAIIATFRKVQDAPFATIAAINGFALGGGCELTLFCDFRIIARGARIGLTEARLGAVPAAGGLQLLAKIVGRAKAYEMILLAEPWTAEQALAAGLVTSVAEADALSDAALALARRLLLCSPSAIGIAKAAIRACETATADEADAVALDAVRAASGAADWKEGMSAFRRKAPPAFATAGAPDK